MSHLRLASAATAVCRSSRIRSANTSAPQLSRLVAACDGGVTRMARRPWIASVPVTAGAVVVPARRLATVADPRSRENIVDTLNGQTLRLPDLQILFKHWPRHVNPHGDQVTEVVQDVLARHTVSQPVMAKLTKGKLDVALAHWYPFATPERLAQLARFTCWMFIFDDELDAITAPGRKSDADFLHTWSETMRVVAESCRLPGKGVNPDRPTKSDVMSAETFRRFGEVLAKDNTVEQRQRFWDELDRTNQSYRKEQLIRQSNQIPQYDAYCESRPGSSCMGLVVATMEYANGSNIPTEIMESPEMKALWLESMNVCWVNNDIISVKKEVADAFLENLVVIASKPTYQLQTGLDHCVNKLKGMVKNMDAAAARLRAKYVEGKNDETARAVDQFVVNCQNMCAGTFEWSLASPRYGLWEYPRDEAGIKTFPIRTDQALTF